MLETNGMKHLKKNSKWNIISSKTLSYHSVIQCTYNKLEQEHPQNRTGFSCLGNIDWSDCIIRNGTPEDGRDWTGFNPCFLLKHIYLPKWHIFKLSNEWIT